MLYPFFRSCIFLAIIFIGISDSFGQGPDTSFRLLWYKGKKLNDITLITISGQRVVYSPRTGGVNVTTPEKKDILATFKKELKKNEQRKIEIDKLILRSPAGAFNTGLITQINRAMAEVGNASRKILDPRLELLEKNDPVNSSMA